MSEEREQCCCGDPIVQRDGRWVHQEDGRIRCHASPEPDGEWYEAEPENAPAVSPLSVENERLRSQRDTLRTALIEAQSVLQQFAGGPLENGNLVHNLNVFRLAGSSSQLYGSQGEFCDFCGNPWPCATQQARDALARIREALEGTA